MAFPGAADRRWGQHQRVRSRRALQVGQQRDRDIGLAQAHDVGEHFPQEARKVHAGESEHRSIRGRASRDEVEALIDEGIPILPVPPAKDDLH